MRFIVQVLLVLVLSCFSSPLMSQDSLMMQTDKWLIELGFGTNLPLSKLKTGMLSDPLITYDDQFVFGEVEVSYFFRPRWAIQVTLQANTFQSSTERSIEFGKQLNEQFANQYFINEDEVKIKNYQNFNFNLFFGIMYRRPFGRFHWMPRAQLGIITFDANRFNIQIKEKNTNNLLSFQYLTEDQEVTRDNLGIGLGNGLTYSLSKKLSLMFKVDLYLIGSNFKYIQTTSDLYTGDTVNTSIDYTKIISVLNFGLGLAYQF